MLGSKEKVLEQIHQLGGHAREHALIIFGIPALVVAYAIYVYVLRVRFFSPMRHMPGPPHGHWLFGQVGALISGRPGMTVYEWHKEFGDKIRFSGFLPGSETVSFKSYSALKTILVERPYECE